MIFLPVFVSIYGRRTFFKAFLLKNDQWLKYDKTKRTDTIGN